MPELPEVLLTSLFLNDKLQNKSMTNMTILGGRYTRHEMEGIKIFKSYKPFTVLSVNSKGKFLWFELQGKNNKIYYLLNRFGLTGAWGFTQEEYSHIMFNITNDDKTEALYFSDARNFGSMAFTAKRPDLDDELNELGEDFLKTTFTNDEFHQRIKNIILDKAGKIKQTIANKEIVKILMNQKAKDGLGSGLGNYLAPEILYDSKISPYTKLLTIYNNRTLSDKLSHSIKYVTKKAFMTADVGYLEDLDKSMDVFIKKLRKDIAKDNNHVYNFHPVIHLKDDDIFAFNVYRQKEDPLGNKVEVAKIITGRSTYWVPDVQK